MLLRRFSSEALSLFVMSETWVQILVWRLSHKKFSASKGQPVTAHLLVTQESIKFTKKKQL